MDLTRITDVVRRPSSTPADEWRPGDAWLAGGTWLFSVPQPDLRRLVDLTALGWEPLAITADGLRVAATCTIAELYRFHAPADWSAAALIPSCCQAFLASFKVWNAATVGGNICMSLPAGPMISLTVALDGRCTTWSSGGATRTIAAADFVTGDHENVLEPGEVLRSIDIPDGALRRRTAMRRFAETALGRSEALLIGSVADPGGELVITVTAATVRPVQLRFATAPTASDLRTAIDDTITPAMYLDDPNGSPAHRRHLTHLFAEQIRAELA